MVDDGGQASVTLNAVDATRGVQPVGHSWRRLPIPACDLGYGCYENWSSDGTKAYSTPDTGLQFEAFGGCLWHASADKTVYYAATATDEKATKDVQIVCNSHDGTACVTHVNICAWADVKLLCYNTQTLNRYDHTMGISFPIPSLRRFTSFPIMGCGRTMGIFFPTLSPRRFPP